MWHVEGMCYSKSLIILKAKKIVGGGGLRFLEMHTSRECGLSWGRVKVWGVLEKVWEARSGVGSNGKKGLVEWGCVGGGGRVLFGEAGWTQGLPHVCSHMCFGCLGVRM